MYLQMYQNNQYLVGLLLLHFLILRNVHTGIPNIFVGHALVTKTVLVMHKCHLVLR